jgi:hypothetical protein
MDIERREFERRELLTWGGIGGLGGLLVGLSILGGGGPDEDGGTAVADPQPSGGGPRHADAFGTVVDAVENGADPDGEEPITDFLTTHAGDDTLLSFPAGEYRLEPTDLSGYRHLGIAAAGSERPAFVASGDRCLGSGESYLLFDGVEDLLIDRIHLDLTDDSVGGIVRVNAAGDATVSNVTAAGGCDGQIALFRFDVLDADATALVRNLDIGARDDDEYLTGVYVGKSHAGELRFRDCTVQAFTDNGLYASAPGLSDGAGGVVHVEGGTYRNNNIANVRLGSVGSTAVNVESISDAPPPTTDAGPSANARGFRLRSGHGQRIENCLVRITADSRFTHGGVVFHETNGGATVTGTEITVDRDDTPAIRVFPDNSDHPGTATFEGVTMTGESAAGRTVLVEGRDETVFRDCEITATGDDRDGIHFWDCEGGRVVDSRIDVTGAPLVLRDATVLVENTTLVTPDGTEQVDQRRVTDGEFAGGDR